MKHYIQFDLFAHKPKTDVFLVRSISSGDLLGYIKWYFGWRQYVFEDLYGIIWSRGCLNDVIAFIQKLMDDRNHAKTL